MFSSAVRVFCVVLYIIKKIYIYKRKYQPTCWNGTLFPALVFGGGCKQFGFSSYLTIWSWKNLEIYNLIQVIYNGLLNNCETTLIIIRFIYKYIYCMRLYNIITSHIGLLLILQLYYFFNWYCCYYNLLFYTQIIK